MGQRLGTISFVWTTPGLLLTALLNLITTILQINKVAVSKHCNSGEEAAASLQITYYFTYFSHGHMSTGHENGTVCCPIFSMT